MTTADQPKPNTSTPGDAPDAPADSEFQRALDHALHFLRYRARAIEEVRGRLQRHGYSPELTDAVIERLRELGYLNDATFALILARDYLDSPRPRGERAILARLRAYGVPEPTARAALAQALEDAMESPYDRVRRAAERWARRLRPGEDRTRAARRLYNHLARAGFDHSLIRAVVDEIIS